MAKEKVRVYKIHYKKLVQEIRKTLRSLEKIENKVGVRQREEIAEQIKSLNYLEGVCKAETPELAIMNPKPKMTGCKMGRAKMTKAYTST